MAQTAAHLVDRPKAVAAVTRILLDEIEKLLCHDRLRCPERLQGEEQATPPYPRPRLGAVSFLHRFGSGLNRHAHLHAAVTDGVFLPGPHGPDGPPAFLPGRPLAQGNLAALTERVRRRVIANLQTALGHAEKRGVLLGLENHDFVKNIDRLLRILRAIDSEWLGVTWDSSNLEKVPDPYAKLARIAPYAITAQIKVMTRVNGALQPADYGRLVQILRDAAYRGYVVLEYEEAEDPLQAIPRHIGRLRELIG
jgi:sugar phosphate isomerase/epimerase